MVHAQVSEAYIHFVIMYTTYHIFPVLLIKDLINKDGETFVLFKIVTGTKTSILHSHVLFFPCVAQKATERFGIKELNMCHQVQKVFCSIFVVIPQHKKGILFIYPTNAISYLWTMSFLMRFFITLWCTRHNHIYKKYLCGRKCCT